MIPTNPPPNPALRTLLTSPYAATPQDYAEALLQYGRSQPPIRTPGALAAHLLADAINAYQPPKAQGSNAPYGLGIQTGVNPDGSPQYAPAPGLNGQRPFGLTDPTYVDVSGQTP